MLFWWCRGDNVRRSAHPGARTFRRHISEHGPGAKAGIKVLREAIELAKRGVAERVGRLRYRSEGQAIDGQACYFLNPNAVQ